MSKKSVLVQEDMTESPTGAPDEQPEKDVARPYIESMLKHMESIAEASGVSEDVALRVCQSFLDHIVKRLNSEDWPDGGHLVIANFGRFEWRYWSPRVGYNPRAKTSVIIPAQRKIRFVPAKKFGEGDLIKPISGRAAKLEKTSDS